MVWPRLPSADIISARLSVESLTKGQMITSLP